MPVLGFDPGCAILPVPPGLAVVERLGFGDEHGVEAVGETLSEASQSVALRRGQDRLQRGLKCRLSLVVARGLIPIPRVAGHVVSLMLGSEDGRSLFFGQVQRAQVGVEHRVGQYSVNIRL